MSVVAPDRPVSVGVDPAPRVTPAPAPRPRRGGRHLRTVEPPRRRIPTAVPVLVAGGIVFAALLGIAVVHALLIVGQLRLDGVHRETASVQEEIRVLRLRAAELESPARVLTAARERLGMVAPPEVGYLASIDAAPADGSTIRVDPAELPTTTLPPEETPTGGGDTESDTPDGTVDEGADTAETADTADTVDADTDAPTPLADDRPSEGGRDE